MIPIDSAARELGLRLGLGDLNHTVCHGYANCCGCDECRERSENPPKRKHIVQPWQPREIRKAA